jgi:hypothetical protein
MKRVQHTCWKHSDSEAGDAAKDTVLGVRLLGCVKRAHQSHALVHRFILPRRDQCNQEER